MKNIKVYIWYKAHNSIRYNEDNLYVINDCRLGGNVRELVYKSIHRALDDSWRTTKLPVIMIINDKL